MHKLKAEKGATGKRDQLTYRFEKQRHDGGIRQLFLLFVSALFHHSHALDQAFPTLKRERSDAQCAVVAIALFAHNPIFTAASTAFVGEACLQELKHLV